MLKPGRVELYFMVTCLGEDFHNVGTVNIVFGWGSGHRAHCDEGVQEKQGGYRKGQTEIQYLKRVWYVIYVCLACGVCICCVYIYFDCEL